MHQGELDGGGRGIQIVATCPAVEESERGKLNCHSDRAYQIELPPANEGAHASGSWRYNSAVWRTVTKTAVANMLPAAIAPPRSNSRIVCPNTVEYGLCRSARLPTMS